MKYFVKLYNRQNGDSLMHTWKVDGRLTAYNADCVARNILTDHKNRFPVDAYKIVKAKTEYEAMKLLQEN